MTKKIGDLLPDAIGPERKDQVALVRQEKLTREKQTAELAKVFEKLNVPQKHNAIKHQIKGMTKTDDTVVIPGRVIAKNEPAVLYLMVEELLQYAGIDNANLASGIMDVLIESYGWMALQDFALFFRKIKSGHYGEVYGKMNGMWITGKINNFQKSVQYNLAIDREAEHFARKKEDCCRDTGSYYNDLMPDIIE